MCKRLTIALIALVLLITVAQTALGANKYDHWFNEFYGDYSLGTARSPYRDNGTDFYANITSNGAQHRYVPVGTKVHNGTDFGNGGSINRNVYAILPGRVTAIGGSGDHMYVIIAHNTQDRFKYMHITPHPGLQVDQWVTTEDVIGTLRNLQMYDGNHLHLAAMCNNTTSYEIVRKLFPFYKHVYPWGYGESLDVFTKDQVWNNIFFITARYLKGGTSYDLESVELYYRINGGPWLGPKPMSKYANYKWSIDLPAATGAVSGDTVDFYLAGIRDVTGSYDHTTWPSHYAEPPRTPAEYSSDSRAPLHRRIIIQYGDVAPNIPSKEKQEWAN